MSTHTSGGWLRLLLAAALLSMTTASQTSVAADTWPVKPIRIIVPTSAGGITDVVTRIFAPALSEQLGQPLIIDNRPGGDNVIGTALAARAVPDGYTLLSVFDNFPLNQLLRGDVPYDARRDFAPISLLITGTQVVLVPATSPVQDFPTLIAALRAKGTNANYATAGIGSSSHLGVELLKQASGITPVAIHMKGGAPAMGELMAARVDLMMIGLGGIAANQIAAGRVRPLAFAGARRHPDFPQLPIIGEFYAGFATGSWMGLVAPAGTPAEIVQKVHAGIAVALRDADVRQKLGAQKFDIVGSNPEEFGRWIVAEHDKWARVIKTQGISAE